METLKNLLDKLEAESKEREKDELYGYEELAMEAGVQSTIKEIREWVEKHSWLNVDDSIVVRYKDAF
jgi:hypothetical protein